MELVTEYEELSSKYHVMEKRMGTSWRGRQVIGFLIQALPCVG